MVPHYGSQGFFSQVNPVLLLKIWVLMQEEPKYFCDYDCILESNNLPINHAEVIFEGQFIDVSECVPHLHSSHQFFQIPELPLHLEVHLQFVQEFPLQLDTLTITLLNFPLFLSHLQFLLQQLRFCLQYLSIDFENTLQAFLRGFLDQQRSRVITCIRTIFIFLVWKLIIVLLKKSKVVLTHCQIKPKPLKVVHFQEVATLTHIFISGVYLQAAHHALLIANLAYLHCIINQYMINA